MSRLVTQGEQAARTYIASLDDSDYRDAARVRLARFQVWRNLKSALALVEEVENLDERLDALLALVRTLNSHHQLKEARELLRTVENLSGSSSEQAGFIFLTAVELNELGLRVAAVATLQRSIALSLKIGDYQLMANAALWLARWGVVNEPEDIISRLASPIQEHARGQLEEIRAFQRQLKD